MKLLMLQGAVILFIAVLMFFTVGCGTRIAKQDCKPSIAVADLMSGDDIDWVNVTDWNCKK